MYAAPAVVIAMFARPFGYGEFDFFVIIRSNRVEGLISVRVGARRSIEKPRGGGIS